MIRSGSVRSCVWFGCGVDSLLLYRVRLFVSFLAFSLQVCAIGILCVFVRDSPDLFLCVVQVIFIVPGLDLGFEQNFQGLGRRKQICSSIWDADEPEVDEAETVGFGRKKDYLIWTK